MRDLAETIERVPCDAVVVGTPIDLARLIDIRKPSVRVRYDLQEIGQPDLRTVLQPILERAGVVGSGSKS
jgi:predicted GTPase